jgi:hypothetical protein
MTTPPFRQALTVSKSKRSHVELCPFGGEIG